MGNIGFLGIIVNQSGTKSQHNLLLIVLLGHLEYPIIFAQMVRIRHIRRERSATIPYRIAILDIETTDSLQQIGKFLFREILHFIAEYSDI